MNVCALLSVVFAFAQPSGIPSKGGFAFPAVVSARRTTTVGRLPTVRLTISAAILAPALYEDSGAVVEPQADLWNPGPNEDSCQATFIIYGLYASSSGLLHLAPMQDITVALDSVALNLSKGVHRTACSLSFADRPPTVARDSFVVVTDDIGVERVLWPRGAGASGFNRPRALVRNYGAHPAEASVDFKIFDQTHAVLYDEVCPVSLDPGCSKMACFSWVNLGPGTFRSVATTSMPGDDNPLNNTDSCDFTMAGTLIILSPLSHFPADTAPLGEFVPWFTTWADPEWCDTAILQIALSFFRDDTALVYHSETLAFAFAQTKSIAAQFRPWQATQGRYLACLMCWSDNASCDDSFAWGFRAGHVGVGPAASTGNRPGSALEVRSPSPVSRRLALAYSLPDAGVVRLQLFDILGRRVALLDQGYRNAGRHDVRFFPGARGLTPGVYVLRLSAGKSGLSRKLLLTE